MSQIHAGRPPLTRNEQHCAALNTCPPTDVFRARYAVICREIGHISQKWPLIFWLPRHNACSLGFTTNLANKLYPNATYDTLGIGRDDLHIIIDLSNQHAPFPRAPINVWFTTVEHDMQFSPSRHQGDFGYMLCTRYTAPGPLVSGST